MPRSLEGFGHAREVLERVEGLGYVGNEVFGVLAAGGEADEAGGYPVMAPAGATLGGGGEAAEAGRLGDEAGTGEEAAGVLLGREGEAEDGAEVGHLGGGGDGVVGMGGQAGVEDVGDPRGGSAGRRRG